MAGLRFSYLRSVRGFTAGVLGNKSVIDEQEPIGPLDQAAEYILLSMRTAYGINREDYTRLYRSDFAPLERVLEQMQERGWAVKVPNRQGNADRDRWRFTPSGFLVSNALIGILIEAQTREKFDANPWMREQFEQLGGMEEIGDREPYLH